MASFALSENLLPIILSSTYAELEKKVLTDSALVEETIEKMGALFFEQVKVFLSIHRDLDGVVLLIGKGHNGEDGYALGRHLIEAGFSVVACEIFSDEERKNRSFMKEKFLQRGGVLRSLDQVEENFFRSVVIDAVFGSGFRGALDQKIQSLFRRVEGWNWPILALDAPSGVSGDDGATLGALRATETYYIDYPRFGFFLDDTPNYTGKLVQVCLNLVSLDPQHIQAYLIRKQDIKLPTPLKKRHKYQAGSIAVWCGSGGMSGSMNFVAMAALKSGAGIVKILHHSKNLFLYYPELILVPLKESKTVLNRSGAWIAGAGLSVGWKQRLLFWFFHRWAKGIKIYDAAALSFLSEKKMKKSNDPMILTPHRGECVRFFNLPESIADQKLFQIIQQFVDYTPHLVVLKGVPTYLFSSKQPPLVFDGGVTGMATAGSGDLLAGMIGALVVQDPNRLRAVLTACYLHQKAGELAAQKEGVFSMTATTILDQISAAFLDSSDAGRF